MPNYAYHFALAQGAALRRLYQAFLPLIARAPLQVDRSIPLDVFAYSGQRTLPEQVLSLRSFLTNAGRPNRFEIVSDGSYSPASKRLLESIDPCVHVSNHTEWLPRNVPPQLTSYLTNHPTGRQLALIMSLPVHGPTLYTDSDIRFFPQATDLAQLTATKGIPAYYLADCQLSADERLLRTSAERSQPVNTGFLLLFQPLDWSLSVSRFLELEGSPVFFTNQTMTQLTMHTNGAAPFDPARYILQLDDQCFYSDFHASREIALRHYVQPVRHKLWAGLCT